jgi:hypothetical protein
MDPNTNRPESTAEVLARMMSRAVISVFAAYKLPLHEVPRPREGAKSLTAWANDAGLDPPTVGARIAFFGTKIHGELMLAATFEAIAKTRPTLGGAPLNQSAASQILARDWTGELANQILGHLKNQSRRVALSFETRTPIPLSGQAVELMKPKAPGTQVVLFRAGRGGLAFCFDAFCHVDLDLRMAAAGDDGNDGTLILL